MTDLSGRWSGVFNYPTELPATAFLAELHDDGGALSGSIEEPDLFRAGAPSIGALIEGRRDGAAVRFVKFYDATDSGYDSVDYQGVVSDDGDEITGRWDIPGAWSSTFLMVREPAAPVEAELVDAVERP